MVWYMQYMVEYILNMILQFKYNHIAGMHMPWDFSLEAINIARYLDPSYTPSQLAICNKKTPGSVAQRPCINPLGYTGLCYSIDYIP